MTPLEQLRRELAYAQDLCDGMKPPAPITPDQWAPFALGGLMESVRRYLEKTAEPEPPPGDRSWIVMEPQDAASSRASRTSSCRTPSADIPTAPPIAANVAPDAAASRTADS